MFLVGPVNFLNGIPQEIGAFPKKSRCGETVLDAKFRSPARAPDGYFQIALRISPGIAERRSPSTMVKANFLARAIRGKPFAALTPVNLLPHDKCTNGPSGQRDTVPR